MRLFRHGPIGQEKPGALDAHGGLRDLSALLPDLTPDWLSDERLAALRSVELERLPLLDPGVRIAEPVAGVRQFVAIGLNYRAHAIEGADTFFVEADTTAGVTVHRAPAHEGRLAQADGVSIFETDGRTATLRAKATGVSQLVLCDVALNPDTATRMALSVAQQADVKPE